MKKVCASVVFLIFCCSVHAQQCWQSISAGGSHTAAIKHDGTLWIWGAIPTKVGNDTDWKLVVAGDKNTFAIKANGTLWGWGDNEVGQIGNGMPFTNPIITPSKIGSDTWKSVVAAPQFTVAIKTDGTLWTWGGNIFGLPGYVASFDPKQVGTASDWKEVSVGFGHAVALKTNNTLWAWGRNNYGQAGTGAPSEDVINFQIGSSEWKSVSAGGNYTMAIKLDGTLWGWGGNYTGQLGIGNQEQVYAPAQVGSSTWKSIDAANHRTIGIKSNGTLWLWGDRFPGNIYTNTLILLPQQITTYSDWESVSTYSDHSFSMRSDKSFWSEGSNQFMQLGEGYIQDRHLPEAFSVVTPTGDAVQTICIGGTLADLKATGNDIKWYHLPTGGTPIPTAIPLIHGKRYYASSTKHGCESASRLDVTVVINPTVTPKPIAPLEQKFCEYKKISDLTVTGSDIKWYQMNYQGPIPGSTPLYTGTSTYTVTQTLGYCESEPLVVRVTVTPTLPPTGNAAQTRCPGATLWSLDISGTSLKYYETEDSTTPLPSTTLLHNGPVFVTQTSFYGDNESCGRLRIDVTVKPTEPPTGDAEQPLCFGAYVFNLKAIGESVTWFDAPTGGNNVSDTQAVNGNFYYAEQSRYGCASISRLKVKAIVNSIPPPQFTGDYSYCHGITLGSLPMNGSDIKWYASDGTGLPSSSIVQTNTNYYASQKIGGLESCGRLAINLVITTITPPFVDPVVYVCNSGTIADLYTRTADNNLKWYESASASAPLPPTTPLVDGKHYWATRMEGFAQCESPDRAETTLEINTTPTPPMTGGGTIVACNGGFFNLPVEGTNIKWYETSNSTTPISQSISVIHGENYFGTQTINGCESPRTEYLIDLHPPTPAPAPFAEPVWQSMSHSVAIRKDGTLWGWGYNAGGQITNGTAGEVLSWATPISFETWKVVEAGTEETFAIKTDGTLWRWGKQFIYSDDQNHTTKFNVPTQIGTDNTWKKISSGSYFTIGLKTNGTLWAWGNNHYGVLGDGTMIHSNIPKQVGTATDWTEVSADNSYVLALKSDGTLWGWGESILISRTQVYNNRILTPIQIGTSNKWRKIDTGYSYWFGIQDDGSLWIGGYKYLGTNGDTYIPIEPEKFYSDTDWKEISVGDGHVMGIKNNGTLWAVYGKNGKGAMGFDRALPHFEDVPIIVPQQVGTDSDWKIAEAGYGRSLAMKNDGSIWTCGSNDYKQLAVHPKYEFSDLSDYYRDRFTPIRSVLIDTECNNLTLADLKASGANIEWTGSQYWHDPLPLTTPLVDGAKFFGQQTTNVCPSREKFFYEVNIIPFPKPIGSSAEQLNEPETQTFCPGAAVADLVAHGADIKWYDASTGGVQLLATSLLINNKHYYASQTFNGCEGSDRIEVIASVGPPEAPVGDLTQKFCSDGIVRDIVATGTNIKWYSSELSVTPLPSSTVLADNTYYYATQTANGCESVSRLAVLASVGTVAPSGDALQNFCHVGFIADLMATGSSIKWYTTASGGGAVAGPITLVDGHHYYASQTVDGCESRSRFEVTVSLERPAPTGNTLQSFCLPTNVIALVATGNDIKWYATPTGGSPINTNDGLQDGHHYYASQTIDGCESSSRLDVSVTVGTKAPTGDPSQNVCPGSTVADLVAEGNDIKWYPELSEGELMLPTTSLTTATTYYATQTLDGCESETRLAVVVTVGAVPPTVASTQQLSCGSTIADLAATGTMIKWYSTQNEGTVLSSETILADGSTYFASQSIRTCESDRVPTVVSIAPLAAPEGDTEQTFCSEGKVHDLVVVGSNIKWYAAPSGGTAIGPNTELTDGTFYYAEQSNSVCVSATRLKVLVSIHEPPVPGGQTQQVVKKGKTISDLVVAGENINWYKNFENAQQGVNPLSPGDTLTNNKSYFATQTISSCESDPLEVKVVFEITLGLETDGAGIKMYPNPAEHVLFIDSEEPINRVSIVDIIGRTQTVRAVNNNKAQLDLSGFASGIYFVHIQLNHQTIVRKVVKD